MCVICDIMGSQKSTIQAKHDRAKNPQTGANWWKWFHARQLQEWVARSHLGWLQPLSTTNNTSAFPLTRSCYNFTQTATSRLHPVCKDLKKHIKLASTNLADTPRAILIKGLKVITMKLKVLMLRGETCFILLLLTQTRSYWSFVSFNFWMSFINEVLINMF